MLTINDKSTLWLEKTESFLKKLAHTHTLYANPTSKEDHGKLYAIFDDFYDKVDFRTWKPPEHDERLWQLFRVKLDQIQTNILIHLAAEAYILALELVWQFIKGLHRD